MSRKIPAVVTVVVDGVVTSSYRYTTLEDVTTFRTLIHNLTGPAYEPTEPHHPTVAVEYDALFQLPQGVEHP